MEVSPGCLLCIRHGQEWGFWAECDVISPLGIWARAQVVVGQRGYELNVTHGEDVKGCRAIYRDTWRVLGRSGESQKA